MTKEILEITSRSHALSVTVYVFQIVFGSAYVLGIPLARSLVDVFGQAVAGLWALGLIFAGALCTFSITKPPTQTAGSIRRFLIAECIGCATLVSLNLLYSYAIYSESLSKSPTTLLFTAMVWVGCCLRVLQISFDLYRIRRAVKRPLKTVEVLAETDQGG